MSLPSILLSSGTVPPARPTSVGSTSISLTGVSQTDPAAILPGHQTTVGSRMPPSRVEPFPPRNGPATPPFLPCANHGPLSLVNKTSVFRSSFNSFRVRRTRPALQSTSSTQSPYLPLADLPANCGPV